MSSNLDAIAPLFEAFLEEGVRAGDREWLGPQVLAALNELADPNLEVAMIGPDPAFRQDRSGPSGFVEAWGDWLSPFDTFRMEVDEIIDRGDRIVTLVRQFATPAGGSIEIENVGAAIWFFEGGKLKRVEFHLDREAGLRAAGLDPEP